MSHKTDPDAVLRRWLDEGPDAAPERFVQAALLEIESKGQRRTLRLLPGRHTMTMHRTALYAATAAAVIVLSAVGLAYITGPRELGGGEPTPSAAGDLITSEQLEAITLDEAVGPEGVAVDNLAAIHGPIPVRTLRGDEAVVALLPVGEADSIPNGFTSARYVEFSGLMLDDPRTRASVATYAALFDTVDNARLAYQALVEAHDSPEGWNLEPRTTSEELGVERSLYAGSAYGRGESLVYLWRERNAVLAAVAWDGTSPTLLLDVGRRMDSATHRAP